SVVFSSASGDFQSLLMLSIDVGRPTELAHRFAATPRLSPDGKAVEFASQDDQGRPIFAVCNLPDCSSLRFLPARPGISGWTANSAGFIHRVGTPENLWAESLEGKLLRQITHFSDDALIADANWSRDGKRLAVARTTSTTDIVLIKGLKK